MLDYFNVGLLQLLTLFFWTLKPEAIPEHKYNKKILRMKA